MSFAFKMSLLSEKHLMTVVINMHKPSYIIFLSFYYEITSLSLIINLLM